MTSAPLANPKTERSALVEHAEAWSAFIFANIMWALMSLPLVTLPAATAGLFTYMSRRARGEQADLFPAFFEGVRLYWRKATLIALLNLLAGGLIGANLLILTVMNLDTDVIAIISRSVTLFAALALLLINLYVWSLLVLVDSLSVPRLISSAVRLVFAHPLWSSGVLIAALLPVLISLLLPQGVFVLFTASLTALIICKGTGRVINRYLSASV